jgi:hypothetical protein
MSYSNPSWSDFSNQGLGPELPLSQQQRTQLPSGVLPSGEAGGLDLAQFGKEINKDYPYPNSSTPQELSSIRIGSGTPASQKFSDDWWAASGILKTYPEDPGDLLDPERETSIFNFTNSISRFSNATDVKSKQIENFTIFNPYIHHQTSRNNQPVAIPFLSTFNVSLDFRPYG